MNIGIVGLGRMGGNMARRLARRGVRVVGFDPDEAVLNGIATEGIEVAPSLELLVSALPTPRVVWLMVPAGRVTEQTVDALASLLAAGDAIV
ncbi:MAG TPA: NAD(P)-binding domain-containing protein, partial [Casimicrobiaceae bacterium]|nr:NAD(P)-binding domain-containing protein [Casimicrobiaceae bacterium]